MSSAAFRIHTWGPRHRIDACARTREPMSKEGTMKIKLARHAKILTVVAALVAIVVDGGAAHKF